MTLPATQPPPAETVAPPHRRVVGVDLSLSATGLAHDDTTYVVKEKSRGMERLHEISEAVIVAALYPFPPALVVIEGYSMGAQRGSAGVAQMLGELGGVVRYRLHGLGLKWLDVPPSSLKLFGAGKGNAGKPDMLDASRRCGYTGSNDNNAVDAWFLRQFGLYLDGRATVPATAYRDKATAAFRVAPC